MVQVQILSKILNEKSLDFVRKYGLNRDFFTENQEEFDFIYNFYLNHDKVPDKETFISKFPEFQILEVTETDRYLLDTIGEEKLYSDFIPILQKTADLLKVNSQDAYQYIRSQMRDIMPYSQSFCVDLNRSVSLRYESYQKMCKNKNAYLIPTGFEELDKVLGGFHTESELVTLFARTGQSKSWIVLKMLLSVWQTGRAVGLIEPEMDLETTGYRWDTLVGHFSNYALSQGMKVDGYKEYVEKDRTNDKPVLFQSLREFGNSCTVSKLRAFVEQNKLEFLVVDGVSYLVDERRSPGDSKTTQLTHIAEDLMQLSQQLSVPIVVVTQANRVAVDKDNKESTPELESIRDSDGLAFNSSVVISLHLKDNILQMGVKKNRRGLTGKTIRYRCNLDEGRFDFEPLEEAPTKETIKNKKHNGKTPEKDDYNF